MDLIATSVRHYSCSATLNVTALLTDARRPQGGAGPCRRLLGERQSEESYLFPRASLTWKLSCCVIWFGFSKKKSRNSQFLFHSTREYLLLTWSSWQPFGTSNRLLTTINRKKRQCMGDIVQEKYWKRRWNSITSTDWWCVEQQQRRLAPLMVQQHAIGFPVSSD